MSMGASAPIRFNSSATSTVGVEVELELVDTETRELQSAASDILAAIGKGRPDGVHPKTKHELLECTVEIITGVCRSVPEARDDLAQTLAEVRTVAEARGLALICSGSHPFSDWAKQQISPNPRYARLVEDMQWPARRLQIFGIHVHVGVRSAEKAIIIANALRAYIPHFLGLSASSPYWMGQDTGLASTRAKIFENLPTTGIPHRLAGWAEFEAFMHTLLAAKAITSIREVWWDIRPHPDFGTVELRICDGVPTLGEVTAMAALSQCLVEWMDNLIDAGERLTDPAPWIVHQNKWLATRYGMDAEIIADEEGGLQPLREAVAGLVDELSPVARRLGCQTELRRAVEIAREGPSYVRQRAVLAGGGTLRDVVDQLIEELRTDRPTPTC
jgi:carboxylate-amine ligase